MRVNTSVIKVVKTMFFPGIFFPFKNNQNYAKFSVYMVVFFFREKKIQVFMKKKGGVLLDFLCKDILI